MKKIVYLILSISFLTFLFGCQYNKKDEKANINSIDYKIISRDNKNPDDFDQVAITSKDSHTPFLVKKASNRQEFEKLWNYFKKNEQVPGIDFTKNNVFS